MSLCDQFVRMAAYNEFMNEKLYGLAAQLAPEALFADRKAYFGSLFATLNHLVVADTIWLKRFCAHPARQPALDALRATPAPTALTTAQAADLASLLALRRELDRTIVQWAAQLDDTGLAQPLVYANMKGVVSNKRYDSLILHFFNHQTHHRGQATTLLAQSGIDTGVTDLLLLVPNETSD
ncbi:DinB family protein [Massilia sp. S19_KUP03_FR1]|uniref:DinB family protein n=1 Tax=Massilia sp. S19_KUP03_FR1 TaxID=3025503 RepID=UPI002FCD9F41